MGRLSAAERDRLTDLLYHPVYYVKVDNEAVALLIKGMRSNPALANGKSVDEVARLRFSELAL